MKNKTLHPALRVIYGLENGLIVTVLTSMILVACYQILMRNLGRSGLVWADTFLRLQVLWLGLLGAMAASRDNNHINVDIVSNFLSLHHVAIIRVFTDLFTAVVSSIMAYGAVGFIRDEMEGGSEALLGIPNWLAEIILPIAFGVIALRYAISFALNLRRAITKKDLEALSREIDDEFSVEPTEQINEPESEAPQEESTGEESP